MFFFKTTRNIDSMELTQYLVDPDQTNVNRNKKYTVHPQIVLSINSYAYTRTRKNNKV